jgi:hypothetical protein
MRTSQRRRIRRRRSPHLPSQFTINRVDVTLKTVPYQGLSNDRKANYDAAKGWAKQAEEALDKNDLVLAKSLADRADTIAKQLAGR